MKIARHGLLFILPALGLALAFLAAGWVPAFGLFLLLAVALTFFFRDPERRPPDGEERLVSPADGRVLAVAPAASAPATTPPGTRLTIFRSNASALSFPKPLLRVNLATSATDGLSQTDAPLESMLYATRELRPDFPAAS